MCKWTICKLFFVLQMIEIIIINVFSIINTKEQRKNVSEIIIVLLYQYIINSTILWTVLET